MMIIEKWVDCWKVFRAILILATLAFLGTSKSFAIDVAAIEKALDGKGTANAMDIQFRDPKAKEKVIVIMSGLNAPSIDMMMLFTDDQCEGRAQHQNGIGTFKLSCLSGGKLNSNFSCNNSSQCFMRGEHSQRGRFIFNFKHRSKTWLLKRY